MKIPASRYGLDVRTLIEHGQNVAENSLWSFKDMAAQIERQVDGGGDKCVQEALNRLARDYGIEFRNVRKLGYLRLDDRGIVDHIPKDREKVVRVTKRSKLRVANLGNYGSLTEDEKRQYDLHSAMLGVLGVLTRPKTIRLIEKEIGRVKNVEVDANRVVELFRPADRRSG